MIRARQLLWVVAAATLLAACQIVNECATFNCRVAAGYTLTTNVRDLASTLLASEVISASDAENVQEQADTARAALDLTRVLYTAQPAAAEDRLTAILTALQALDTYLRAREAAAPPLDEVST